MTVQFKSNMNPMFPNKFAEDIFNQKYRHDNAFTWAELCKTLVEDVCRDKMTAMDKDQLIQYMTDMKFIPGGRYLYYAGRANKYFNNCFSGDTKFITNQGLKTFKEAVDTDVYVLTKDQTFRKAVVKSFGKQQLYRYTFSNVRGRSTKTWEVEATANHRWLLKNGTETTNLDIGDYVPATGFSIANCETEPFQQGYLHGLVFADGNVHNLKDSFSHQLRLCGSKAKEINNLTADQLEDIVVTYPNFANGDPVLYIKSQLNLKKLPPHTNKDYIAGFLYGWFALDGHDSSIKQIHTTDLDAMNFFMKNCHLINLVVTGNLKVNTLPSNFGERAPLYYVNLRDADAFAGFKVISKVPTSYEEVYCVVEPVTSSFTLEGGMLTGNCYLLRALEDSREDWADLSKRAETCLATGGGIGVDYSVYRASGSILHKTGGLASGPISKMKMINEIGREIMQGGSRRSAMYASLHWKHGDIQKFLTVKDWKNYPVGSTGKTLWDIKQEDFNFPCPLDMTNISVNYDTEWLQEYWATGKVGETFLQNTRQALSSAEPGFSFNFFDKENETLRNACTEVTSEDDSDVCNLGSINLSRIQSITEFSEVVELATKFLVCGTLVADLPMEQVRATREKNRRLGLGLMGMHEWLVQRGYKYEVTEEMHRWLKIYEGVSKNIANTFADELSISRPVAVRAIAPTGTIGILAGTTTGIEPIFSVAYKRRYLKGTKWHYQYVVDGAAKSLIDKYNVNPDNLESALDMAVDYERRIKFQADVQDYVDMAISSTINLPSWGSDFNNESTVAKFADTLARYAHRLRGFTCYPDGSRGGQPITSVPYSEAVTKLGDEFEETHHDICEIGGKGGTCGI